MSKVHFPITYNNYLKFYQNGDEYLNLYLDLINSAQISIHLQTYIFDIDTVGIKVKNALILSAKRGVKIFLLIDSIGSSKLSNNDESELIAAGITLCKFNGIKFKSLYKLGRRVHHKILLIDNLEAIVGGINIHSPYTSNSIVPQLDFAVHIKGESIAKLLNYCETIFKKNYKLSVIFPKYNNSIKIYNNLPMKISVNDWILGRYEISKQYSLKTKNAKKEIIIINPYFFPRRKFLKQLIQATKRGVNVKLILPRISDWQTYILASEFLYNYLLIHGIEIYLWEKSILHGKLAIIDNDWTTIGSFNLNYTSYQQNLEINVDIYSETFVQDIKKIIDNLIQKGCTKLDPSSYLRKSNLKTKISRFICYIGLSLIANFSIGISFQEQTHNQKKNLYYSLKIISTLILLIIGIIGFFIPNFNYQWYLLSSLILIFIQLKNNQKFD